MDSCLRRNDSASRYKTIKEKEPEGVLALSSLSSHKRKGKWRKSQIKLMDC